VSTSNDDIPNLMQETERLKRELMNRVTKIALLVLSYVAVAFIGAAVGWFGYEKMVLGFDLVDEAALVSRYTAYNDIQRTSSTGKEYKEALLAYLEVLERLKQHPSRTFTERTYYLDKTMTYARLSLVANREGNKKEAEMYLQNALAACTNTGWRDCSKEGLHVISTQIEETSRFQTRN
jgi:hypothetical protein